MSLNSINKKLYAGRISNLISDSLLSWIGGGLPEELDYRIWFSKRLNYYKNKIENAIVSKKPSTKDEVLIMIQEYVDYIKETVYTKERENGNGTESGTGSTK